MKSMNSVVPLAAISLALGLCSGAAAQQGEVVETFVCESVGNKHNECEYNAKGQVTVHVSRQLSRTRCVFDENWGTWDGGVWVDYGCRAEFEVRRPPGEASYRPTGGSMQTIACESRDYGMVNCPVDNIDPSTVHVERQLSGSPCDQGRSWGVSEGENSPAGIWVSNGCRATFAYQTRGGQGGYQPYAGTDHDFELPCESYDNRWIHCEVHHVNQAQVEIIAGNDACNAYKAWGVDDTGIWVREGCQGAFRVKYRY